MSRTSGMFSRMTGSSVRMEAAMAGSAAFLAPLTRIVPTNGLPPRITNLSIRLPSRCAWLFSLQIGAKGIETLVDNLRERSKVTPPIDAACRSCARGFQCNSRLPAGDGLSDVPLSRLEFLLRLATVRACFQHDQRYGHLVPRCLQGLGCPLPVH